MGLKGAGLGAGLGFAAGGPGGALLGAGLGGMAEDQLFGAGAPSAAVAPPAPVTYGGTAMDYAGAMQRADMRDAPLANYSLADQDRALAMQARQDQLLELERLRATARGEGPSAAAIQMQAAQEQAAANAANVAASARGTSGQGLATREAIRAQMQGAQTSARDTAIIRAQEALQAQQAATALASGMRGQAGQERGMSQQQAQFQAQQQLAGRGMNDQRALALLQAQIEEEKARAGVAGSNEDRSLSARMGQMQAEQSRYRDQKDRDTRLGTALIGAGGTMAANSAAAGGSGGGNTGGANTNSGNGQPPPWTYANAQNG